MLNKQDLRCISGNQLKLLAMAAMTLDHIGVALLPQVAWLRWAGRLAMPIFAYMIAEGCRYTRSRGRYLAQLAALAALCQVVYFVAMGSLYMCILVTFSLSVCLIWLLDTAMKRNTMRHWLAAFGSFWVIYFLSQVLPALLPGTDYAIDYGFVGICLPVMIWLGRNAGQRWLLTALGLGMLGWYYGGSQWLGLLALIPLALYSGQRGKRPMKYLFYIYYPAHLAVIHLLSLVL